MISSEKELSVGQILKIKDDDLPEECYGRVDYICKVFSCYLVDLRPIRGAYSGYRTYVLPSAELHTIEEHEEAVLALAELFEPEPETFWHYY